MLISAMLPGDFHGQNLHGKTLQIRSANLTVPCPPPTAPAYPSIRASVLDPAKTHEVAFSLNRMNSTRMLASLNCSSPTRKTEGDIIATPRWENQTPPASSLVWADAATPDTLLDPQPVADRSFCAQGLAGRSLVAWAQPDPQQTMPLLYLLTSTGYPYESVLMLADQKVTLKIAPAQGDLFPSALRAMTNPQVRRK